MGLLALVIETWLIVLLFDFFTSSCCLLLWNARKSFVLPARASRCVVTAKGLCETNVQKELGAI